MATTGFILPTANNDDSGIENAFNNPANAQTDNTSYSEPAGNSAAWFWKTFDFSGAGLSSGDTVTGMNLKIRAVDPYGDGGWFFDAGHKSDASNVVSTYTTQRIPAAGDFTSGGGAQSQTIALTDVPTATEALSSNFRLMIQVDAGGSFPEDARIEAIWLEIIYTAAGPAAVPIVRRKHIGFSYG